MQKRSVADLEGAEHGEEALANDEGEEEVDGDCEALAGGPRLQRLNLTRHQPPQWTPRPPCTSTPAPHLPYATLMVVKNIFSPLVGLYIEYRHSQRKSELHEEVLHSIGINTDMNFMFSATLFFCLAGNKSAWWRQVALSR